jgi:quinoprotein glucose dehydrogenase
MLTQQKGAIMRRTLIPVILLGAAGIGLAAFAYFPFGSGVEGTVGALLALLGAVAVTLGAFLMAMHTVRGVPFGVLAFLVGLGAVLTALAGYFLMQYGLAIVMGLALLGLLIAVLRPARQRRPV